MVCRNCGKEMKEGARFCNHCGTMLVADYEKSISAPGTEINSTSANNPGQNAVADEKKDTPADKAASVIAVIILIAVVVVIFIVGKWIVGGVIDFLFGKDKQTDVGQSKHNLTDYIDDKVEIYVDGTEYSELVASEFLYHVNYRNTSQPYCDIIAKYCDSAEIRVASYDTTSTKGDLEIYYTKDGVTYYDTVSWWVYADEYVDGNVNWLTATLDERRVDK